MALHTTAPDPASLDALLIYTIELADQVAYTLYQRDGRWVLVPERVADQLPSFVDTLSPRDALLEVQAAAWLGTDSELATTVEVRR